MHQHILPLDSAFQGFSYIPAMILQMNINELMARIIISIIRVKFGQLRVFIIIATSLATKKEAKNEIKAIIKYSSISMSPANAAQNMGINAVFMTRKVLLAVIWKGCNPILSHAGATMMLPPTPRIPPIRPATTPIIPFTFIFYSRLSSFKLFLSVFLLIIKKIVTKSTPIMIKTAKQGNEHIFIPMMLFIVFPPIMDIINRAIKSMAMKILSQPSTSPMLSTCNWS